MTRSERIGTRRAFASIGLVAFLAASVSGCTSPRIQVTSSDAAVLRGAPALELVLVAVRKGEEAALDETATAALVERAREALRAKGYPDDGPEGDPILLELALLEELVSKRTYTADTDASGARFVKRPEAIVALRAIDPDGKTELWRCEARGLLPKRDAPFGPSEAAVFERLLEHALARIPARP
ncbi:MAG: hypothetical protein IPK00_06250 [Deltaproteobacteria bacterium]|nr:hypothetical protein [Deltaproteobacteria bacterium]